MSVCECQSLSLGDTVSVSNHQLGRFQARCWQESGLIASPEVLLMWGWDAAEKCCWLVDFTLTCSLVSDAHSHKTATSSGITTAFFFFFFFVNAHKTREACSLKDLKMQVCILSSCVHLQYVHITHMYDQISELLPCRGRDAILWNRSGAIYKQINYASAHGN